MSNVERYYKYLRKCEMMGKEATFEFEVDEEKDKVTLIRYNETDEDFRVIELPSFVTHIGIYPFFSVRQSLKIIHKDNQIKDMPWFMSGYDGKRLDLSEFDATGVKETMFMFGSNNTEVDTGIKRRFNVKYEVI